MRQIKRTDQFGVTHTRRLVGKGEGRGNAEKITRVNLGDVAGERCIQQIVGSAAHRLSLEDGLPGKVVVEQALAFWSDSTQKLAHGVGQRLCVDGSRADDILFQEITSLQSVLLSV